jgi:hypothetical protein
MDLFSVFCRQITHFSQQHLLKKLSFSPLYVFGDFVKNKMGIVAWIYIWVLSSVPIVFLSVYVPAPCCFIAMAL